MFSLATNALLLNEADRVHASCSCTLDGIMCRNLRIKEGVHGIQHFAVVLKYVLLCIASAGLYIKMIPFIASVFFRVNKLRIVLLFPCRSRSSQLYYDEYATCGNAM